MRFLAHGLLISVDVTRDDHLRFERTARELRRELHRAASRLAGRSRADDLVQETLLRAFAAWRSVIPGRNPRAWMHAILRNTFYSERRTAWRESALDRDVADHD